MVKRKYIYYFMASGLLLLLAGIMAIVPANAQEGAGTAEPAGTEEPIAEDAAQPAVTEEPATEEPAAETAGGSDNYCILCHGDSAQTHTLSDGTVLDLEVNTRILANSVHGSSNPEGALSCTDCHGEDIFPHDGLLPISTRELAINSIEMCSSCHEEQAHALADSVHAAGLERGNLRAATCADCHGSHNIKSLVNRPAAIVDTCSTCHVSINEQYISSVHGRALLENNDPNVPACTDCHIIHSTEAPTTAQARNRSPELCASCHANEELMDQYGISTHVFDTYLSEFHGKTIALFEQQDPAAASNKAVCYDCHGVHNILPADEEKSQVAKENLLATCQQCHPNATANFPDSWVGHFAPTAESSPGLFAVQWFYRLLIPMVIGGFAIMVGADAFGRVRRRFTNNGDVHHG